MSNWLRPWMRDNISLVSIQHKGRVFHRVYIGSIRVPASWWDWAWK